MAGFVYSYRQCTSRNLQHIYSGNERSPTLQVREKKIERFLERRKLLMDLLPHKKKDYVECKYNRRLNYYDKEQGINMPKAPAFREADSETIYEIVKRLHRPQTAHVYNKTPEPSELASRRINSSKAPRTPLSKEDVNMIFARLHVSHTQVSRIKSARSRQEVVCRKDGQYVVDETNLAENTKGN